MRRKRERKNKMRIDSDYFKGEHLSLDVLKTMTSLCHHRYLFEDMPPYPKAEFHIANISHVTTAANLDGIMDSSGFKGGCETDLLYWSLHINKSDIDEAEDKYLRKEFPSSAAKATGKRSALRPILEPHNGRTPASDSFLYGVADVPAATTQSLAGGGQSSMAWRTKTIEDHPLLQPSSTFTAVATWRHLLPVPVEVFVGSHFIWNLPLDLSTLGDPSSGQHSSWDHWYMQASPPQQGGDSGEVVCYMPYICRCMPLSYVAILSEHTTNKSFPK
ncbi:uncharacterized protein LOC130115792 isoform X4 [Lampris incognitus]|uniref:uncharacterized protein LOC130115792 isoform X4 n=1 Tax=Lampris incognitus TaxID=2546036 RepID=UPI0024B4E5F5|nr:uncharacterized protein LOC130115792 isoform X4 [Lampris incognitus]